MQDFPWKDQNSLSKGSGFENELVEYRSALKWPEFSVNLPSLGNFSICPSFFKKFDYSDAMVRLIASAPGYHSGNGLKKWGHMELRSVLQECTFDEEFKKSPLVYQALSGFSEFVPYYMLAVLFWDTKCLETILSLNSLLTCHKTWLQPRLLSGQRWLMHLPNILYMHT